MTHVSSTPAQLSSSEIAETARLIRRLGEIFDECQGSGFLGDQVVLEPDSGRTAGGLCLEVFAWGGGEETHTQFSVYSKLGEAHFAAVKGPETFECFLERLGVLGQESLVSDGRQIFAIPAVDGQPLPAPVLCEGTMVGLDEAETILKEWGRLYPVTS